MVEVLSVIIYTVPTETIKYKLFLILLIDRIQENDYFNFFLII